AVLAAAKAVLVPEGIDPNTDAETFVEFERRFGVTGMIAAEYTTPSTKIGDLGPKETTAAFAAEKLRYAKGFVEACKTMSEELGQKLKANETKPDQAKQTAATVSPAAVTQPVTTLALLAYAIGTYFPHLVLASSFGAEDVVLIDMVHRLNPKTPILYLDTDFLFKETYETRDRLIQKYGIAPIQVKSLLTPEQQAEK